MLQLIADLLFSWPSILAALSIVFYIYSTRNHDYWKSRGINGPKPWPLIGTSYQRYSKPICIYGLENHRKFGRIFGLYDGSRPVLSVAEPELIKDICVKDFQTFVDRGNTSFGDPLFDRSLLTAKGEQWKNTRSIVSPAFSSGKLKKMHGLIEQCVTRLDKALDKIVKSGQEINLRQTMVNYTMDVIAICAFATKLDTHNTGNELHPLIKNSQVFFKPSPRFGIYFFLTATVPSLVKKFELSFVSKDVINYFKTTLRQIIAERKSKNLSKNVDFLQLLIDAQNKTDLNDIDEDIRRDVEMLKKSLKNKQTKLEEIDILATALIFLLAGHDTTASTLSYLFHELALNPEVQEKLYEEISSQEKPLSLEQISQLPFLDACISETLRKYPPLSFNQRMANKDYQLGNTGLLIPKGMAIQMPVYAMHYDPSFFPNPEKFNPERFMSENKSQLIPYTFLPFGVGPRNCIGMRFALNNIKTAVVSVLSKYRFIRTSNTKITFEYKKFVVFTQALDMRSVGIELRK